MKKIISVALASLLAAAVFAQQGAARCTSSPAPTVSNSTPATAADVEALRQQVQSLTETVKALQQQVKDQQAALEKANLTGESGLPENPEPSPIAGAEDSPAPSRKRAATVSNRGHFGCFINDCARRHPGRARALVPLRRKFSHHRYLGRDIGTGNDLKHGCRGIVNAADHYRWRQSLHEHLTRQMSSRLPIPARANLNDIEVGDHDPQQRGFNARNTELAFDGAVDPYFQGFANIVFLLDNDNQTEVELEEAFLQTTSLPFNLQLKGGQFFADFGRIEPDASTHLGLRGLASRQRVIFGPDGLRGVGAQASWTLPLPWYSQLVFASQNGRGETGFSFRNPGDNGMFFDRVTTDREARGLQDFVWIPRFENSFNLERHPDGAGGSFGSVWLQRNGRKFANSNLRRRPSLQMEKLARRRRFSVCKMANGSHVSPFPSRPWRG